MNETFTAAQIQTLIAAGIDLKEFFGVKAEVKTEVKATPAAKEDGRNKAARTHNYEARIARREDPKNAANAKGLTKAEKSKIYATLPKGKNGKPSTAAWNKAVAAYKAAN